MLDLPTFTLSTGEKREADFAFAYDEVPAAVARNRGAMSVQRVIKMIYRLLRLTPDMLMVDICMVREAWAEYLTVRQIEEALKNG